MSFIDNFEQLTTNQKEMILKFLYHEHDSERRKRLIENYPDIDFSKANEELTFSKIKGFIFQKKFYEVDYHKDVLLKICKIILEKFPNEQDKLFSIKGRTKIYFSKNVSDFRNNYDIIEGTDIYADVNVDAVSINKRCQKILQKYGIDHKSEFKLIML